MMLELLKNKKIKKTEYVSATVEKDQEEIDLPLRKEQLPQIKLFITEEQLSALKEHDDDRVQHALLYLDGNKQKDIDDTVFKAFNERFEKAYTKLGNTNNKCPHCLREYNSAPAEVRKCLGCSKGFFKTKRPQDGMTVLVKEEHREVIKMQWENIKKAEMVENLNQDELKNACLQLESKNNAKYTLYDIHFMLIRSYAAKALRSGRFRLYSSLIYYMAEYDRYEKEFAKALSYYFYLYFLQLNGASNSVVFGDKVAVNERIVQRISSLLKMAKMMTTECEDFFKYSIEARTAFDFENLPYGIDETYSHLVKSFEKAEGRETVPQVLEEKTKAKSFRLQRKAV